MNYEPFTSIKNHLIIFNLSALIRVICGWSYSTTVESSLQINPFYAQQTQFQKKSNDVNPYNTRDYERKRNWTLGENKPNLSQLKPISNPIKPNFRKAKMNANVFVTMDYKNFIPLAGQKNKPNSNPIKPCPERSRMGQSPKSQNERKLIFYRGLQKKRGFRGPNKQTQSCPP